MIEHRFTKGVADYASGALLLVRSRVAESRQKNGGRRPSQLLLHVNTTRRLLSEAARERGALGFPGHIVRPGLVGRFEGTLLIVCDCGDDLGEDQLIDHAGRVEPL